MRQFHCIGHIHTSLKTYAESPEIAAELFREEHGVLPEFVDGLIVSGGCRECDVAMFVGDGHDEKSRRCRGCAGPALARVARED